MTDRLHTASTEVLEHEAVTLAAQIAAAICRWLLVIAELDRRQAWGSRGCTSMAHWLAWRCSLSPATAWEHVRVARALPVLPEVTGAFERGELSYSKVRALTRVATAESEGDLLELACTATAAQLEKVIRASVVAMSDPTKREELRRLSTGTDADGMGHLHARMRIDELAIVERALDSSAEESRVDALVSICESYLAHGEATRPAPARNHAVVHVEVDREGVVRSTTEGGAPLPPSTAARLLCDATVQGMLGDLHGPIGVGRTTRTIPERLRRALHRRSDGGCEWLGCGRRKGVEAHHVWHWTNGGPTELWNLVHLCWHHHHLVHEGGWQLRHDDLGELRCVRPDGSELRDPAPIDVSTFPLVRSIDHERIVPRWRGERFDRSTCVEAVLTARGASP